MALDRLTASVDGQSFENGLPAKSTVTRVRHALNRFWFAGTAPNYNKIGSMSNMETIYKPAFVKASGGVRPLMAHSAPPAIKFFADGYAQNEETLLDNSRITPSLGF